MLSSGNHNWAVKEMRSGSSSGRGAPYKCGIGSTHSIRVLVMPNRSFAGAQLDLTWVSVFRKGKFTACPFFLVAGIVSSFVLLR